MRYLCDFIEIGTPGSVEDTDALIFIIKRGDYFQSLFTLLKKMRYTIDV